jgi:hypothetical protein
MSYSNAGPRATGRDATRTERELNRGAIDPRLVRFLEKLSGESFFGKVVVSFQNGKVTDVKTEQTRKLDEL